MEVYAQPKENLLETIRKGGHPERLPVCFAPFRPIGGDPVFRFVRGNRVRGTNSYDRWGIYISFPEDQPAAIPIVTPENQVIRNIEKWRQEDEIRREIRRVLDSYGRLHNFIPSYTYGGPGTIFPHVLPVIHEEIERYNREHFGV